MYNDRQPDSAASIGFHFLMSLTYEPVCTAGKPGLAKFDNLFDLL